MVVVVARAGGGEWQVRWKDTLGRAGKCRCSGLGTEARLAVLMELRCLACFVVD